MERKKGEVEEANQAKVNQEEAMDEGREIVEIVIEEDDDEGIRL